MKICKLGIFVIGMSILLLSSISAIAEETITEGKGDVYHWYWDVNTQVFGWKITTDEKPNVDIIELKFNTEGDIATFTITVSPEGEIENSPITTYWVTYLSGDITYWVSFTNGVTTGMTANADTTQFVQPDYSINANTLSIMVDSVGEGISDVEFHGYAYTWTESGGQSGESWWDYAPDEYFPGDIDDDSDTTEDTDQDDTDETDETDGTDDTTNGDSDTTSNGTPGFEAITLIAVIGVIYFVMRRKK